MDRQTRDSLISIMTSSEGADILKSIVSACQNLQADESENIKPKKFNALESLFYGELYEIGCILQQAIESSGAELPEEIQADLDRFVSNMAEHNVLFHSKERIKQMYSDMGTVPPVGESPIDILRGLHYSSTQTHKYMLTSSHDTFDGLAGRSLGTCVGFYPGSLLKIYIGDKKSVSITLKAIWRPGESLSDVFPLPMVAISSRDLDLYYPYHASDAAHYNTDAYSFFQAGSGSRCHWIEKRNLTNNITTFLPDVSYVAPNDGSYTNTELTVALNDSILNNGNIRWLYVGLDDNHFRNYEYRPRIMEVIVTSEYDNYYVRT